MFRAVGIAPAILFASTAFVLAQGGTTQSAPPPQVLSQTGTMYDSNNANLQLPAEPTIPHPIRERGWDGRRSGRIFVRGRARAADETRMLALWL